MVGQITGYQYFQDGQILYAGSANRNFSTLMAQSAINIMDNVLDTATWVPDDYFGIGTNGAGIMWSKNFQLSSWPDSIAGAATTMPYVGGSEYYLDVYAAAGPAFSSGTLNTMTFQIGSNAWRIYSNASATQAQNRKRVLSVTFSGCAFTGGSRAGLDGFTTVGSLVSSLAADRGMKFMSFFNGTSNTASDMDVTYTLDGDPSAMVVMNDVGSADSAGALSQMYLPSGAAYVHSVANDNWGDLADANATIHTTTGSALHLVFGGDNGTSMCQGLIEWPATLAITKAANQTESANFKLYTGSTFKTQDGGPEIDTSGCILIANAGVVRASPITSALLILGSRDGTDSPAVLSETIQISNDSGTNWTTLASGTLTDISAIAGSEPHFRWNINRDTNGAGSSVVIKQYCGWLLK